MLATQQRALGIEITAEQGELVVAGVQLVVRGVVLVVAGIVGAQQLQLALRLVEVTRSDGVLRILAGRLEPVAQRLQRGAVARFELQHAEVELERVAAHRRHAAAIVPCDTGRCDQPPTGRPSDPPPARLSRGSGRRLPAPVV